jgi:gliding motility-associated lipoprotein GldB
MLRDIMYRYLPLIIASIFFLASCNSDNEDVCVFQPEASKVSLQFTMLQDSFRNVSSKSDLVHLLTRHPVVRDYIFRRADYPDDSVFVNELYARLSNPHFDTLNMEVKRVFGNLSTLKSQFEEAFSNMKYYYPDIKVPKVQTIVSGLIDNDLLVTDSLIIVSLDYFLGRGAKYRPKMYEYLLRKYDPDDIVPSCMLIYGISDRYNKIQQSDQTVLADMITYGKAFYFAKHMLPCEPDSVLIWYTPEEMNGSRKNEDLIWARFIESQVLFSTSKKVKQDYLGERPVTIQVGEKCPGRIGQWVGWRIVNKFHETHPDIKLPELMALEDAQKIFKESRYKPN